jgi:hypothetical protein
MYVMHFQTRRYLLLEGLGASLSSSHYASTVTPYYFEWLNGLEAKESEAPSRGPSITGIVEGSAVVYAALLESIPASVDLFMDRIERDLAKLPPIYREFWDYVVPLAGSRTPVIILPLAAVSLCYEQPHIALPAVCEILLQSEKGGSLRRVKGSSMHFLG